MQKAGKRERVCLHFLAKRDLGALNTGGPGTAAAVIAVAPRSVTVGNAVQHGGLAPLDLNGGVGQLHNGVQRPFVDDQVVQLGHALVQLVGVAMVALFDPVAGGTVDVEIAHAVQNTDIITVIMPVDAQQHAMLFALVGGIDDIKGRYKFGR